MKTTIKVLSGGFCAVFLFLAFTFSSCGDIKSAFSNGRNFTEAEDVKDLEPVIMEHITPEMEVMKIDFGKAANDASTFSSHKGVASIYYVDPENPKKQKIIDVNLKDGIATENDFWKDREHHRKYTGVKNITGLGCAKIADNVSAAGELLAADSLAYNGVGSYSIEFDSKSGDYKHKFSLERRTGSDARKIYYDEYSFIADAEGNVKPRK